MSGKVIGFTMRLWKKILVIVVVVAAIFIVGGISIYKFVIIPKYIEPVLISASSALRDADVQDVMMTMAQDLADKGVIDKNTLRNYMNQARKYTVKEQTAGTADGEAEDDEIEVDARINTSKTDETTTSVKSQTSSLGVKSIKTIEDEIPDEDVAVNQSYSEKFNTDNYSSSASGSGSMGDIIDFAGEDVDAPMSSSRANSLYNKIINAMSAHERSVFFSVIGKADTGKLMSLYQSGNKSEAAEYLQGILGSGEYEEAVSIFYKYAPLLMEE